MLALLVALLLPPPVSPEVGFRCLDEAYPGVFAPMESTPDGRRWAILRTGARLLWDDGVLDKSLAKRLAEPDLEDTFATPYPLGRPDAPPGPDIDPGRVRLEGLMRALYGESAKAVRGAMVPVAWMSGHGGGRLSFNERHGAAEALRRVSAELDRLPRRFHRYVVQTAGTFNWRRIKGTTRLSAHAFAIAVDINVKYTDYWRWAKRSDAHPEYRNRVPYEIVEVFERHGFIWGGKWHHFDTMHFEYRPELLHPACASPPPAAR
jgi:hypothetical protein